jgi:hypothetical protein
LTSSISYKEIQVCHGQGQAAVQGWSYHCPRMLVTSTWPDIINSFQGLSPKLLHFVGMSLPQGSLHTQKTNCTIAEHSNSTTAMLPTTYHASAKLAHRT